MLPSSDNLLPEPMLANHQCGPVTFIWGQLQIRHLSHQSLKLAFKSFIYSFINSPHDPMSKKAHFYFHKIHYFFIMYPIWHDDFIKWKNKIDAAGHLCVEFPGGRWIPCTKASDTELWCFLWSAPEWTFESTFVRLVIWDAIAPIMSLQ